MADEAFAVAIAAAIQTARGTENIPANWTSGTFDETDGAILGDRESGDAESGITLPTFARRARAVADVAGSFTKQPDSFEENEVQSLTLTFQAKGNGATVTPSAGETQPDAGIDAIVEGAGLIGANGTSPVVNYTPRHNASSGGAKAYLTIGLWIGSTRWYLKDCIVQRLRLTMPAGEAPLFVAEIVVGSIFSKTASVTFPTVTYGNQATLSAPVVTSAPMTYGTAKGFGTMDLIVENDIERTPDSNEASGIRLGVGGRTIRIEGTLFLDAANPDFEYDELERASGARSHATIQLGAVAGAADTANGIRIEAKDVQPTSLKHNEADNAVIVDLAGFATGAAVGDEFELRWN